MAVHYVQFVVCIVCMLVPVVLTFVSGTESVRLKSVFQVLTVSSVVALAVIVSGLVYMGCCLNEADCSVLYDYSLFMFFSASSAGSIVLFHLKGVWVKCVRYVISGVAVSIVILLFFFFEEDPPVLIMYISYAVLFLMLFLFALFIGYIVKLHKDGYFAQGVFSSGPLKENLVLLNYLFSLPLLMLVFYLLPPKHCLLWLFMLFLAFQGYIVVSFVMSSGRDKDGDVLPEHEICRLSAASVMESGGGSFGNVDFTSASGIQESLMRDIHSRLIRYFEEQEPFLNPTLKINDVALAIFTNKTYLSRLLNLCMNTNFNHFVNSYRIKKAMSLFEADHTLKVTELSSMVGFNNMPSFIHAFRMSAGCSPSEWCRYVRTRENSGMNAAEVRQGQDNGTQEDTGYDRQ